VPFPQHRRKHLGRPLFTAAEFRKYQTERLGSPPPRPPAGVVLAIGRRWREHLRQRFGTEPDRTTMVYRARPSVGVLHVTGPGAPYIAIEMEELVALGVRRFVLVGAAGSLQPELRAGTLALCSRALRDEGTSFHYARSSTYAYPSSRLTKAVRSALDRARVPYVHGPSWTIDAAYRETVAEIRRYRSRGILTVEMEASAAFTVARVRGCEAAALFVVSDHLDDQGWEPMFYDIGAALGRALDVAVSALAR
jgi:uridine phosphorylase